jgi:hypothetical protein
MRTSRRLTPAAIGRWLHRRLIRRVNLSQPAVSAGGLLNPAPSFSIGRASSKSDPQVVFRDLRIASAAACNDGRMVFEDRIRKWQRLKRDCDFRANAFRVC